MVIEDIVYPSPTTKNSDREANRQSGGPRIDRLGSPLDRAAAVVADLVFLIPVYSLVLSPFRKDLLLADLSEQHDKFMLSALNLGFVAIMTYLLYETIFIAWKGATPGKWFLGLRVRTIWHDQIPRPSAAFLRSLVWLLELCALGIPFLAVFSNERRRAFHDRVADTIVLARGPRFVGAPTFTEITLVSGLYSGMLAFLTVVSMVSLHDLYRQRATDSLLAQKLQVKNSLCPAVGDALGEWWDRGESAPPRMEVALALYNSGAVDEECLEVEADFSVWRDEEKALAYLAKAVLSENDPKAHGAYLEKTCEAEPASKACELSRLMTLDPQKDHVVVSASVTKFGETTPSFMKVWGVSYLLKTALYDEALRLTSEIPPHSYLGEFFSASRAKALWALNRREEARQSARAALENLAHDQQIDLAGWFCYHESTDACSAGTNFSCAIVDQAVARNGELMDEPQIALSLIKSRECSGQADYTSLAKKTNLEEAKHYLSAMGLWKNGDKKTAIESLRSLSDDIEPSNPFYYESLARVAELTEKNPELEGLLSEWTSSGPEQEGWLRLGKVLLSRFSDLRLHDQVVTVAGRLAAVERNNVATLRLLVVAAYQAGQKTLAGDYLQRLDTLETRALPSEIVLSSSEHLISRREPASADSFEEIAAKLRLLRESR